MIWRHRFVPDVRLLTRFQPLVGSADFENLVFLGEGAADTGAPADINEAARVEWIDLDSIRIGSLKVRSSALAHRSVYCTSSGSTSTGLTEPSTHTACICSSSIRTAGSVLNGARRRERSAR